MNIFLRMLRLEKVFVSLLMRILLRIHNPTYSKGIPSSEGAFLWFLITYSGSDTGSATLPTTQLRLEKGFVS
jgi:hypothetical protein